MDVKSIFTIQKLYIAFEIFAFSMILPYLARHFCATQIATGFLVLFLVPLPLIFFSRKIMTEQFMFFAFLIRLLCLFIFFVTPSLALMYVYFFFIGLNTFFFWVPYNIRYFVFSHKMNRATSAGHFIIVGPILNSFIPLLSGYIVTRWGYLLIAIVSFFMVGYIMYKTIKLPKVEVKYNFFDMIRKAKGMRTLKFLQGFWEGGNMMIGLFTLFFIQGELAFGGFLSYLGIVGVLATLFVTKYSDKDGRRMRFFFPFLLFLAISTMSMALADNLGSWVILSALAGIFSTLTYPFFFAVLLDKIEDKVIGMVAREFFLNLGRVCAVGLLIGLMYNGYELNTIFLFSGAVLLVYAGLLLWKKTYLEEAYYPLSPVAKVYDNGKNVVSKIYAWGKVVSVKEAKAVGAKVFTGARWMEVSFKNLNKSTVNKILDGVVRPIFNKPKFTELRKK